MKRARTRFLILALAAGLAGTLTRSCLPPNFFADLAGDVVNTTVSTVLNEFLNVLLSPATGA
jgi:hypothetical protein